MERIYCDYAAATPIADDVRKEMEAWLAHDFANPSSTHEDGQKARIAIDDARRRVSGILGCNWNEVVFMASGTESANAAVLGHARARRRATGAPVHVVTSAIEHHAVLDACKQLEREGDEVTYVRVSPEGLIDPQHVVEALRPNTVLVSIIYANNEIGTIQPISEIAEAVHAARKAQDLSTVAVHTDACQAGNYLSLNVKELGVDLLTLNGSKIYGPKGSAVLYKDARVALEPLLFGGGQEFALRPGTENVAAIAGLAKALEQAQATRHEETLRLAALRDVFLEAILKRIPDTKVNGNRGQRLANNINIFFPHVDGDIFLFNLSQAGISASLGSACTAGSIDASHVLTAIGLSEKDARQCVRFTFGRHTSQKDLGELIQRTMLAYEQATK